MILGKPNLVITEMWAIIATDKNGEGVMGGLVNLPTGSAMLPFVGADKDRILSLLPKAVQIAAEAGVQFKICKFTNKQDVTEEFFPRGLT